MKNNTYVAIMAGGVGSRFWPGSREAKPKQFLDILGVGKSLLRLTFERFLPLCPAENIFIVTHKKYKQLVLDQLPELTTNQVLCEPSRNNTAPSVAYTAFKLHALNPDANFVIAPSDHIILKEEAFIQKLRMALSFAEKNDALLTLGIQPSRPDTGYGYINFGEAVSEQIFKVKSFKEKPDESTAQVYLDSGHYLWNAGIFIWKAENILKAFKSYLLKFLSYCKRERIIIIRKTNKPLLMNSTLRRPKFLWTLPSWRRLRIFAPFLQISAGQIWAPGLLYMQSCHSQQQEMYVIHRKCVSLKQPIV